jgi:DNA-binding NarL/FixJ family response regulator/class 3 adenylate cyclase
MVTFLFTDIEGSTQLLVRMGETDYARLEATHHAILRGAFSDYRGVELRTEGDSFFVAFADATDGVAAAFVAQVELQLHRNLRVRMGLHSGEAVPSGNNYTSLAVNTAARISAAAHGGQVVLSQPTREQATLPKGVTLLDLGEHRLKDLSAAQHLYQLEHPELPTGFPSIDSLSRRGGLAPPPPTSPDLIRLLLVDDEAMVRTGLRLMLETEDDLRVVGEAANGVEAIEQAERANPDVVLMDIRMPRMDGVEACRRLVETNKSKVVILTTFDLDEHLFSAIRAGACGFLLKASPPEELVTAIRAAHAGNALIEPGMTRRLLSEFARQPALVPSGEIPARLNDLTEREVEVLRDLARGLSNAEIGEHLYIGEATVKTHVTHILGKLGLRDRIQAVVLAYESGLVEPNR